MPFVYFGTGWLIGIWAASALHLPIEYLLPAFLVPIVGLFLWRHDRRAQLIWGSVIAASCGAIWFTPHLPHFDQNSLSSYKWDRIRYDRGVIAGPPDVRDTYINLRVNADRLTTPDRSSRLIEGAVLVRPSRPAKFHYGERVQATDELTTPPEFATFNHADFLARQGVYSGSRQGRGSVIGQRRISHSHTGRPIGQRQNGESIWQSWNFAEIIYSQFAAGQIDLIFKGQPLQKILNLRVDCT